MAVLCSDWITGDDVAVCCSATADSSDTSFFDGAIQTAQELLFQLSGRQFAGECEQTVRPCLTRCRWGFQVLSRGHIVGWDGWGWNWSPWWPDGIPCGCRPLSRVKLSGYPVSEILEVKIDGAVVDPSTYRLDRLRYLTRTRADAGDQVLLWPVCQSLDLSDTEPGTWSVTYSYGQEPPQAGKDAASELACEIYKACLGQPCALPSGLVSVSEKGVLIGKPAFTAWGFQPQTRTQVRGWRTGMAMVDAFLTAYNPDGLRRRPVFWSPASTHQYPLPEGSPSGS